MNVAWDQPVAQLFRAIQVDSPHQFTLGGRPFALDGTAMAAAGAVPPPADGKSAPSPLVGLLGNVLYQCVYCRPFRGQLPESQAESLASDPALGRELAAANTTRERWEHGWQIRQMMPTGQVLAQRGSQQRSLWPGQFLSQDGPGARPRPGAPISVYYPKESTSLQEGFYYVFGQTPEDEGLAFGIVRVYWNVAAEGAPALVGLLSTRLNRFHVPFRCKCSTIRGQFERTDVAVVYLARRLFPIFADLLCDIHPGVRAFLGGDVPLFAKRVAAGVGVAEDPGNGESFGQHRCRLLAEALWNCFLRGNQSLSARLGELERLLVQAGVDPQRPYLNAGSLDWYEAPRELA